MWRRLVLVLGCVVSAAGCQNGMTTCPVHAGPVTVDVSGVQPKTAAIRTCRDEVCGEFIPLAQSGGERRVASHADLPATLRLDVAVGGQILQSYQVDELNLRKPSGKGCDEGESVRLTPAPGGRFAEERWGTKER